MIGRRQNMELTGDMSPLDFVRALEEIRFTAARGWRRSISIDDNARKVLIESLCYRFKIDPKKAA